ncbi:MAG: hypothetical protein QXD84_07950 [Thermoplasmata archaeon]
MRARTMHPVSGVFTMEKAIEREEGLLILHNRIHRILTENGLAKDEPGKQRRRKWVRYERRHNDSRGMLTGSR